jgi:hypothetical protein
MVPVFLCVCMCVCMCVSFDPTFVLFANRVFPLSCFSLRPPIADAASPHNFPIDITTASTTSVSSTSSSASSSSLSDSALPASADSVTASLPVHLSTSPFDPINAALFVTDRLKVRAVDRKNCQRLVPAGGPWGWFGWHLVPADATTIVITEGEFDAMAVYQATGFADLFFLLLVVEFNFVCRLFHQGLSVCLCLSFCLSFFLSFFLSSLILSRCLSPQSTQHFIAEWRFVITTCITSVDGTLQENSIVDG